MGFSRQEYWSGLSFPTAEDLSDPGVEPTHVSCVSCIGRFFITSSVQFSSVHFSHSVVANSLWPHGLQHARLPCPLPTFRAAQTSNHLIFCPSTFPSIRVFSNESVLHIGYQNIRVSASASVLPNEYSGLISLRIDWMNVLAVQGTLKNLVQHHSSKTAILLHQFY